MVMIFGSCNFQELDKVAVVEPFSKFCAKAIDISQIPKSLFKVQDQALFGRPGGCYLDLPNDILHQTVSQPEVESVSDAAEDKATIVSSNNCCYFLFFIIKQGKII